MLPLQLLNCVIVVKATAPAGEQADAAALAEMDLIKKRERKMRKELEERERELSVLRTAVTK
jgi:hypothetical protein|tara:strand:+ start:483 stop:668 length:186 start_codon:yes stop_codon:yes gene_type:complete